MHKNREDAQRHAYKVLGTFENLNTSLKRGAAHQQVWTMEAMDTSISTEEKKRRLEQK